MRQFKGMSAPVWWNSSQLRKLKWLLLVLTRAGLFELAAELTKLAEHIQGKPEYLDSGLMGKA